MKITKLYKSFGQKIGSTESYSSFDLNVNIEVAIDIDIDTPEGQKEFKETSDRLVKILQSMYKRDLIKASHEHPELAITLEKKMQAGLFKKEREIEEGMKHDAAG